MGNHFTSEVSVLQEMFSTFMHGNIRQDISNSSPTAPTLVQGDLVLFKAKLLLSPTPTTFVCGHGGSMGSTVLVCLTLPPSFLDKSDSVGLGSSMQLLHIGKSFTFSAHTSSSVVTSSIGLEIRSFRDWGRGDVPSFGFDFNAGLGVVSSVEVAHFIHALHHGFCLIYALLQHAGD